MSKVAHKNSVQNLQGFYTSHGYSIFRLNIPQLPPPKSPPYQGGDAKSGSIQSKNAI